MSELTMSAASPLMFPAGGLAILKQTPKDALLPRFIVHKTTSAEVLLTSDVRIDGGRWTVGFELPRSHWSVAREPARQDVPLVLMLELVRQAGLAIAHLGLGVPLDWRFLMREIAFSPNPSSPSFPEFGPLKGSVAVSISEMRHRKGELSGLRAEVEMSVDGTLVARGAGDIDFMPGRNYAAVRRNAGDFRQYRDRKEAFQVSVFAGAARVADLSYDWDDPFFFDHPSDHVPGMLLAQAAIDAHRVVMGARSTAVGVACQKFVEFGSVVTVNTEMVGANETRTTFTQGGSSAAVITCVGP